MEENKYIYISVQPFDFTQTIYTIQDGLCSNTEQITNDKLVDYMITNPLKHIKLDGPPDFLKGFVKKIKKAETNKYGKNDINIEYNKRGE